MAKEENGGRKFPNSFYNIISLFGVVMAAVSFGAILFLFLLDFTGGGETTPYLGILAYIVFPAFLILGLILIPIGMWRERRRRFRTNQAQLLPYVDLNLPHHRRALMTFTVITTIFLLFTAVGSYHAYEFSESVSFCGNTCHSVMHPELITYNNSPHARVKCVECHVGSGAGWYVQSKLSGAYQVYSVLFNKYPKPIPTPIENLRPARETCEQCHWPQAFFGSQQDLRVHYRKDEENSLWYYNLLIKIGGGNPQLGHTSGIHWHMNIANKIEYIAADHKREEIPWVRSTNAEGNVKVYASDPDFFDEANIDESEIRVMDCMDCHNRPSHIYLSPNIALNRAMSDGRINPKLPFIKQVAADLLMHEYESKSFAAADIDSTIRAFYAEDYPEVVEQLSADIDRTVREVQAIYDRNNFPEMKASWRTYPDHIGHFLSAGCYRCHDGLHESPEGETISNDCNACHLIIEQGDDQEFREVDLNGLEFIHPEDIGEAWKEVSCHECHGLEQL